MRFIVEIEDGDLENGCASCPMNYDYQGCLAFHGSANDDPMFDWELDGSPKERPKDCPLIPLSCASCPEMDNPDSYIAHLHRALEVADEGAKTCKLVIEKRPRHGPWIYHYSCGYDFWQPSHCPMPVQKHCPNCGRRIKEEAE